MFADPGSHEGLNRPDACWKANTRDHRRWVLNTGIPCPDRL